MSRLWALAFGLWAVAGLQASGAGLWAYAQDPGAEFMPIVMMVGCVQQDGRGGYLLTDATDPVALEDRIPDEPTPTAALGEGQVRLVGTLDEFGVGNHTSHKVRVRGLYLEGESQSTGDDEDRLNLTSIMMLATACR